MHPSFKMYILLILKTIQLINNTINSWFDKGM